MKFTVFFIVFFVAMLSSASANDVTINCRFTIINQEAYTCTFVLMNIPDIENVNIIIGGNHLPGYTDNDVKRVEFLGSITPFVVSQVFTYFPNLTFFTSQNSALTRIQSNAFINAENLEVILVIMNLQLETIQENAFTGAPNVIDLNLRGNRIDTIHENAFRGLFHLNTLRLNENRIRQVSANLFNFLPTLERIFLQLNQLEELDDRLFANKNHLFHLDVSFNKIKAIGGHFLENLPVLNTFHALENRCINLIWRRQNNNSLNELRTALQTCFDNFVPSQPEDNELRRIVVEVRGKLRLKFENGTEIVTI